MRAASVRTARIATIKIGNSVKRQIDVFSIVTVTRTLHRLWKVKGFQLLQKLIWLR